MLSNVWTTGAWTISSAVGIETRRIYQKGTKLAINKHEWRVDRGTTSASSQSKADLNTGRPRWNTPLQPLSHAASCLSNDLNNNNNPSCQEETEPVNHVKAWPRLEGGRDETRTRDHRITSPSPWPLNYVASFTTTQPAIITTLRERFIIHNHIWTTGSLRGSEAFLTCLNTIPNLYCQGSLYSYYDDLPQNYGKSLPNNVKRQLPVIVRRSKTSLLYKLPIDEKLTVGCKWGRPNNSCCQRQHCDGRKMNVSSY